MSSLIVAAGPAEGEYYPLDRKTTAVGGDSKCPIQILDDKISRVHLEVRFDAKGGTYHAKDLQSVNGVQVNGDRIRDEVELKNGDVIQPGDTSLVYFTEHFSDREAAWAHYKIDQRRQPTMVSDGATTWKKKMYGKGE